MTEAPAWPIQRVRIGRATVAADQAEAVTEAVERFNGGVRLADLPDALNPAIIDPGKVGAFLAAVARLPAAELATLAGLALDLTAPELPLRTTSPTMPRSFGHLAGLDLVEIRDDGALTRARLAPDHDLARLHADGARKAMAELEREIAARSARDVPPAISGARARGSAIARTWLENAAAVRAGDPDDPDSGADEDAARQAVAAWAANSGDGPG